MLFLFTLGICPYVMYTEVRVVPAEERKSFDRMLLKVNVISEDGDRVKVNLPLSLIKVALEIGMQLPEFGGKADALKDIDFKSVLMMAESGVIGKLVEVRSASGDIVEVTIE